MKKTIIHIGYHKSASTFLQEVVFPQLPVQYFFLDKTGRRHIGISSDHQSFHLETWLNYLQQNRSSHETTLITHEALSGHPHGYEQIDPTQIAHNLHAAHPNAKILIIIRNQFDYLKSIYTYRVSGKGAETRSFSQFLNNEPKLGIADHICYNKRIQLYQELFGSENVYVIPLEYLKTSPSLFYQQLSQWADIPIPIPTQSKPRNTSTKILSVLNKMRKMNYIFKLIFGTLLFPLKILQPNGSNPEQSIGYRNLRFGYYQFRSRLVNFLITRDPNGPKLNMVKDNNYHTLYQKFAQANKQVEILTSLDLVSLGYPHPTKPSQNS